MNKKCCIFLLILFLAILLTSPTAYAQTRQKEITIGLIPEINVFRQVQRYRHLEKYLTGRTGTEIEFSILTHYGDIIDYYLGMKLDGAFFGSLTAALAKEKLEIEHIVRPVDMDGNSTYHGCIFVRRDSGIKGFKDLKGKVMVFVDKATTAGYVFPIAYLRDNGVSDVHNFFSEYYFAGSHDATIMAVLDGKADVGAAKNTIYDALMKGNSRIDSELTIIAESMQFPSNGLILNKYIDKKIKMKIRETLLDMDKDPEGREVLSEFGIKKFIKSSDDDLRGVYTILERAGIRFKDV